jgi:hypothetical protein
VSTSRPLGLVARDRSRREPGSRPTNTQFLRMHAWPEAKPASTPAPKPASTESSATPEQKRDGATSPFPIAIMVMVGVSFGSVLGLVGWPVLQALGVVSEPVIQVVQRSQADLISRLDTTVHALNAAVAELSARVDSAADRQEAAHQHMADIDANFGALRKSMNELREAQNAARESWLQPVAELNAAATKARSDIVRLRASVDELSRLRQPEATSLGARIDRIERAMALHELPGGIRGSIAAPGERPRSLAARESSSAAADGHIINLTPAR